MPRRFFNRILPRASKLKERWYLRPFNALLHDPALWTTHRKAVARALALGLFIAFLPIAGHLPLAAAAAVYLRVNVAVALLSTFVTNPITLVPIFYSSYALGCWLLGQPLQPFAIELSWDWLVHSLGPRWKPLLLGSVLLGTLASAAGYAVLNLVWRLSLSYRFRRRRWLPRNRRAAPPPD